MKRVLSIEWFYGVERITVPVDLQPQENEIQETEEYWPDYAKTVVWHTTSERIIRDDGSQQIKIHYAQRDNGELSRDYDLADKSATWGTSTITIKASLRSATAEWAGRYDDSLDGKRRCLVSFPNLLERKERETISRIKKRQAQFRDCLIAEDRCCCITGETTRESIEAAHIIDAAADGRETIENGILLRADLHRLYDAGLFEIREDGAVKITGDISKNYQKLISSKTVDTRIMSRIREAVKIRLQIRR